MLKFFYTPNQMEDLTLLTRHLAGALASRAPLPNVLQAYGAEAEPGAMRRAMIDLAGRVESGVPLSSAMDAWPRLFPPPYRRLVRLGEEGRSLANVMSRLAETLEQGLKSYEFVRRAALYPLLVLATLFLILSFIEVKILPKYQVVFEQMGAYDVVEESSADSLEDAAVSSAHEVARDDPRRITRITLLVLLLPIAVLLAAVYGLRIPLVGYGRFILHLPLVGGVLRRAEAARFSGQLALLLENRIPMHEALGLLSQAADNRYVQDAIHEFQQRCEAGESLASMLEDQPLFPPGMAVMVSSAQDQGRLPETLEGLSRYYTERTAHGVAVIREFVEPLLLILVAFILIYALAVIYLPLFDLPNVIAQ